MAVFDEQHTTFCFRLSRGLRWRPPRLQQASTHNPYVEGKHGHDAKHGASFLLHPKMTAKPTFGFVIPCFNEEDNVGATVGSVREGMGARDDYEIILINDASTDQTLER